MFILTTNSIPMLSTNTGKTPQKQMSTTNLPAQIHLSTTTRLSSSTTVTRGCLSNSLTSTTVSSNAIPINNSPKTQLNENDLYNYVETPKSSDNDLLNRAQQDNDSQAVRELCLRYKSLINKYARHRTLTYYQEEAANELWLTFLESIHDYDIKGAVPFAGYVQSRISYKQYNLFRKYRRQWNREESNDTLPEPSDPLIVQESPDSLYEEKEGFLRLRHALQLLPDKHQQLLQDIYYRGQSLTSFSRKYKTSKQVVSYHHRKALGLLKVLLKPS